MQSIAQKDPAASGRAEWTTEESAALAELVTDAVLVSRDGRIVRANRAAARLLACDGELADRAAVESCRIEDLLEPRGIGGLLRETGEVVRCRTLCAPSPRSLDLRSRLLDHRHWLHLVSDPGDADRSQHALVEAARDLAAARERAAEAERACREAIDERRELVDIVCHELRTPITVVRGYAKLLLSGEVGSLNEEQRRFVEESARSCSRLDEFVELLLRATNEQRAAMDQLVEGDASLQPVLEGVLGYLKPVLDERGVRVELDLAPDALWARFDAARIEQVVANLLNNGIDHAGTSGTLRIHTRRTEAADGTSWVEVGVSDDGPGVPVAERDAIFTAYRRGSAPRSERGLGLGLSICRRIVEAHGGHIEVRDAGGSSTGSCFAFVLPAAQCAPRPPNSDRER